MRAARFAWLVGSRDLVWRWRRFAIAVAGTSLAFALTLVLTAFRERRVLEVRNTLDHIGADGFVVKEGLNGPFTTTARVPADLAYRVARLDGVDAAAPMVSVRHTIETAPRVDVYLIGVGGGLSRPRLVAGRAPERSGDAVLDERARRRVGDSFALGGMEFEVVGLVRTSSVWGGVPDMFVTLADAQQLVVGSEDGATAIVTRGLPTESLPGYRILSRRQADADLLQPVATVLTSVDLFRLMIWIVAAAIISSLLYISALERTRDFAVFKAVGAPNISLLLSLAIQAVALAAVSAAAGMAISRGLEGFFPSVMTLPARTALLLPIVAVTVGFVGCMAGARRALAVDPAAAFAGP